MVADVDRVFPDVDQVFPDVDRVFPVVHSSFSKWPFSIDQFFIVNNLTIHSISTMYHHYGNIIEYVTQGLFVEKE